MAGRAVPRAPEKNAHPRRQTAPPESADSARRGQPPGARGTARPATHPPKGASPPQVAITQGRGELRGQSQRTGRCEPTARGNHLAHPPPAGGKATAHRKGRVKGGGWPPGPW
ncbi:hypothetical protein SBRY_20828 [Actinacidiphila bryophytorum]|uniref:Uncharacterized protein n=1 Tax=Actinacidiphila bryophytorum TaxID=1436133 RepID=A0A9W4EDW5_9ACTN|nr:hypothetical protein SBRY_20828 [Actinacidiphila bryophytorum]